MNRKAVAQELVKLAKELTAVSSQEEVDKLFEIVKKATPNSTLKSLAKEIRSGNWYINPTEKKELGLMLIEKILDLA